MSRQAEARIGRREVVLALTGAVAAAATPSFATGVAAAPERTGKDRKARYQADSPEVQTFYRVNRYPKR
jgi:hypothetical protein